MIKLSMLLLLYATTLFAQNIEDSLRSASHVDSAVIELKRFGFYGNRPQYTLQITENGIANFHLYEGFSQASLDLTHNIGRDSILLLLEDLDSTGFFEKVVPERALFLMGARSRIAVSWSGKKNSVHYFHSQNPEIESYAEKIDRFAKTDSACVQLSKLVKLKEDKLKHR